MIRVLVTDGGSVTARSTLAAVRALHAAGHEPWVTVSGRPSLASSSRHCAGAVTTSVAESGAYPDDVRAAVEQHGFFTVMCSSDVSLLALRPPGHELVRKDEVSRRAEIAGLPLIPEWLIHTAADVAKVADGLDYPVAVKPIERKASDVPVQRIDRPDDLIANRDLAPLVVQRWVDEPLSAYSGVMHDGRMIAVVAQESDRLWPASAGVSCYARTTPVDPDRVAALEKLACDHEGVIQAQFIGDSLIDLNPRVYGSLPLALAAGLNLPAIHIAALRGEVQDIPSARVGVRYRWIEGDVRHVVSEVRRRRLTTWQALGALAPHRGTAHSMAARDPAPTLRRLRELAHRRA